MCGRGRREQTEPPTAFGPADRPLMDIDSNVISDRAETSTIERNYRRVKES